MTCSTQYMDAVQRTISTTLGIKESTINMSVRRLGGAFGGKVCLLVFTANFIIRNAMLQC